jgi:RNA polymerase sigma-70 factor (ECF subfamily)
MSTVPVTVAVANLLTLPSGASEFHESRESAEVSALVAAAREGSQDAFNALVRLHQRVVYRTAFAALGTREDAEDAAQEAFVVAWRKLAGFRGDSTFRTWLLTIVWRKALDKRRVRLLWRQRTVAGGDDTTGWMDTLAGGVPDPERTALASDQARRVREEIKKLTPKLRDTLLLAASGEHSYDEIAALLDIPLGTVKWRVAEARRLVGSRIDEPR